MPFLTFKRKENFPSTKLAVVAMLNSFGIASFDSIASIYLNTFFNNLAIIGMISSVMSFLSFLFYAFSTPIIVRFAEKRVWLISSIIMCSAYIIYSISSNIYLILVLMAILLFSVSLQTQSLGIIVRDITKKSELNKAQGLLYALINVGWLIGPLIAAFIAENSGFKSVFILCSAFTYIAMIRFISIKIDNIPHGTENEGSVRDAINAFFGYFKDINRVKAYFLKGGITLYWSLIYLYMPLFIADKLGLKWVGIFLFAIALPLVILEYPIGKVADKYGGRKIIMFGFFVLSFCSLLAFVFIDIWYAMIFFVFASFGAAFLEGTTEAYFFTITDQKEEEKYYGPFQTSAKTLGILAKLAAALVLFFFPEHVLYLFISCLMFFMILVAGTIKDNLVLETK